MSASIRLRRFVLALSLAMVGGLAVPTAYGNPGEEPTVHLVAIGDVDIGGDFGRKLGEDARNIVATFENAFAKAGKAQQLQTQVLLGEEVTPENVLATVAKLEVRKNDTLIVLYSGHGEMQAGQQHVLTFHHGDLTRKRLLAGMQGKHARLIVLLTDCCSSGVPARSIVPQYQLRTLPDGNVMEWRTVQNLFLRHSGLVDLTSSEPGFPSRIDRKKAGSLFTNALVRVLKTPHAELVRNFDRDGDRQIQWDELLPQVRALAAQYDRQQGNEVPQQAYATSLGVWMPTGTMAAR